MKNTVSTKHEILSQLEKKIEKIAKGLSEEYSQDDEIIYVKGKKCNKKDTLYEVAHRACTDILEKVQEEKSKEMVYDESCACVCGKQNKKRSVEIAMDGKRLFGENWIEEKDKNIVNAIKERFTKSCGLKFDYVAKNKVSDKKDVFNSEPYHIVRCCGGKNGNGKWTEYFSQFSNIFNSLSEICKDVWLIDIENDSLDDVFDLFIGLRYGK